MGRRARDDDRLCQGYTVGTKMPNGRVWLYPPRPCRQWAARESAYCRWHMSIREQDERRAARTADGGGNER